MVVAGINRLIVCVVVVPGDLYLGDPVCPEALAPHLRPSMSDAILPVESSTLVEQTFELAGFRENSDRIIAEKSAGDAIVQSHQLGVVLLEGIGVRLKKIIN